MILYGYLHVDYENVETLWRKLGLQMNLIQDSGLKKDTQWLTEPIQCVCRVVLQLREKHNLTTLRFRQ